MTKFKTAIAGLILLAVGALLVPGLSASAATQDPIVVETPDGIHECNEEWSVTTTEQQTRTRTVEVPGVDEVNHKEYQFRKTVTTPAVQEQSHVEYRWDIQTRTPIVQEKINKETSTRYWVKGTKGQHYSWTGGNQNIDTPPTVVPPHADWQANTHQEPHNGVESGLHFRGNGQNNASWFYFTPGTEGYWGEYGPWTDWPDAGPVWDDGRDRGPAGHGSGDGWERIYRYVVVDTRVTGYTNWVPAGSTPWGLSDAAPADTLTTRYVNKQQKTVIDVDYVPGFDTTYYYNGGAVSTTDENIWTTDQTLDRSWEQFRERTVVDSAAIPPTTRTEEYTVEVEVTRNYVAGWECPPVTTTPEPPTTTTPEPPVTTTPEAPTTTVPMPEIPTTTETPVIVTTVPTPPAPTVPTGGLPSTGSNIGLQLALAAGIVAGGAAIVAITRRRKATI